MRTTKFFLAATVVGWLFTASANAIAFWKADGTLASTSMVVSGPTGPVYVTFLVNFQRKISCYPEIGLLMATGTKLGDFVDHKWSKNSMSIHIDSKTPWSERTAISKYSNGYETTIAGNNRLLEEIMTGREAFVSPFPGFTHFVFPLAGSGATIRQARFNCSQG